MAITGGMILPAVVIVLLIVPLSVASGCLGDELG